MKDQHYMQRCLQLAQKGKGSTAPNPMVGAILVYNDSIIGEGYHHRFGEAHAEVNCFESVLDVNKKFIPEATMYVSLEPCAHYGKTPPCTNRIVLERVKKVVICNTDPFDKVAGKGMHILKENGIEVVTGVLEKEGHWINRRFFTFHKKKRPYIILKWAETRDGFFAPLNRSRFQMTDKTSLRMSHQWRRDEAAIMVGFTTALNDNPQLVSRFGEGSQPLRIVLDKDIKLPSSHNLLQQKFSTWIINQRKNERIGHLNYVKIDFSGNVIQQVLDKLYQANILSLLVEGGSVLLQSFIKENLWDEARIFQTPSLLENGIAAPNISNNILLKKEQLDNDFSEIHLNKYQAQNYQSANILPL